jgi:hypothetical protein
MNPHWPQNHDRLRPAAAYDERARGDRSTGVCAYRHQEESRRHILIVGRVRRQQNNGHARDALGSSNSAQAFSPRCLD